MYILAYGSRCRVPCLQGEMTASGRASSAEEAGRLPLISVTTQKTELEAG